MAALFPCSCSSPASAASLARRFLGLAPHVARFRHNIVPTVPLGRCRVLGTSGATLASFL